MFPRGRSFDNFSTGYHQLTCFSIEVQQEGTEETQLTFALEIQRKQTLIIIPVIVT